jgi:hypothetical protein
MTELFIVVHFPPPVNTITNDNFRAAASYHNNGHKLSDQSTETREEKPEGDMMIDRGAEESVRTPLDKLTARTVNHARKLSKRLKKIQKKEVCSSGCDSCDKDLDSDTKDYLTLVVSDKLAKTEPTDKASKSEDRKGNKKGLKGSFEDGFPKSPSGRLTRYLSGDFFLSKVSFASCFLPHLSFCWA